MMIKYETKENEYYYNLQDIKNILNVIKETDFYNANNCTQEKVANLIDYINTFLVNIKSVEKTVIKEKHETEEQAREYFGEKFISEFDKLMTLLDKQQTVVALHGTNPSNCPSICKNGLMYKNPVLSSTAVLQNMEYGMKNINFSKYETLLNWPHREYKGLVIIAVPYECFYKEGLWNQFSHTDSAAYGGQDYKIDPDFIVGYVDVNNKKIILNPKYNRTHDYSNYETDYHLFHENKEFDNNKFSEKMIKSQENSENDNKSVQSYVPNIINESDEEIDVNRIPVITEDLLGLLNSLTISEENFLTEERYKSVLEDLSNGLKQLQKIVPTLKTDQEVIDASNQNNYSSISSNELDDDGIIYFDDWDTLDVLNEEVPISRQVK